MSKGFFIGLFLIGAAVLLGAKEALAGAIGSGGSTLTTEKVDLLVRGIALAEGGWDASLNGLPGTRPFRNNNPGDLMESGDLGQDSGGYGIFSTADYPSAAAGTADRHSDGFAALFFQAELILSGRSRVYSPTMTWAQVAQLYDKGGDALNAWLPNVASIAGMSAEQTVAEWVNS